VNNIKAIIGGTGIYDIGTDLYSETIQTEYGDVAVDIVSIKDEKIVFLSRHGKKHSTPPHLINYRANMKALCMLGVTHAYATVAVGSINNNFSLGDLVIINDFMDFTKARNNTFFDGSNGVKHVDMSDPYCKMLRAKFSEYAIEQSIDVKGNAVYVCTEGPRFETAAEIKGYKLLGADVVGMTNVPEVVLAKELGICYSAVGIITNWATGFKDEEITFHDIKGSLKKNKEKITSAFIEILSNELNKAGCNCANSVISL